MLVHRRVTHSIKFAGTHLYTWVERGTVRVKCLAQEHNTMSPVRVRTRTARSGDKRTNHEATTPPTKWYILLAFIYFAIAKIYTEYHHIPLRIRTSSKNLKKNLPSLKNSLLSFTVMNKRYLTVARFAHRQRMIQGPVSRKSRKLFGPGKP